MTNLNKSLEKCQLQLKQVGYMNNLIKHFLLQTAEYALIIQ